MKIIFYSLTLSLLLLACNPSNQQDLTRRAEHVIVIGVDGMSTAGVINAKTPVMDSLMANGAYTLNARGVLPTSSSPNWASMVSGASPAQHGVTSNGWERDDRPFPPVTTGVEDIFPTIFSVAHVQDPKMKLGAVYQWTGFGRLIERSVLDYDKNGKDENETAQLAEDYIKDSKPGFLFVHFDHVDHAGHTFGHKTEKYYQAVAHADELIGNIIQATKDAGIFDQTVFIVSADHGGIGYGHGGETLDELEIPFIVYGKGVKKDHLLKCPVYTYDNAATVAFVFGFKQPYAWIGKPVKSAFEGFSDPESMFDEKVAISAPTIYPKANLYDPAGGLFVDSTAVMKIVPLKKEYQVYYTLDGTQPTKKSTLYQEPVKIDKSCVVLARAFSGDDEESVAAKAYFRLVKSGQGNGVHYQYYEGHDWRHLPVFATLKPKSSGDKYEFRIGDINQRDEQFAIKFTSFLQIDKAGQYRFYTLSDDGSKLYVNGDLVVDNDGGHGAIERSGDVELKAGMAKIEVEYFNEAGGSWLEASYKGPDIPKQVLPADKLFLKE